jgi:hypothetical protein
VQAYPAPRSRKRGGRASPSVVLVVGIVAGAGPDDDPLLTPEPDARTILPPHTRVRVRVRRSPTHSHSFPRTLARVRVRAGEEGERARGVCRRGYRHKARAIYASCPVAAYFAADARSRSSPDRCLRIDGRLDGECSDSPLYKNCTALNKRYWHGIGRTNAHDKTSGAPVTTFRRSNRLYRLALSYNKGLDRDKDGIACEKA